MSEEKILAALEENPTGLSISDMADKAGIHRNTVTTIINKLEEDSLVEMKQVGLAKVYYLKKYRGLHKIESGYKGKNISVGIGVSDMEDGFKAAISAAKQAANQSSNGAQPTFSLVFVSSKYNPQIDKVVKGVNSILGTNWVGCTTDRELNSVLGYSEGTVEILCMDSQYLHFGVGVAEEYRKNPPESGKKAITQAIENCPVERSVFATTQFMRGARKGFMDIVRNPPFFILAFPGGMEFKDKQPVPGMELEFLDGVFEALSSNIPVVGASAASDFNEIPNAIGSNYAFANGKAYSGAAVLVFAVSDLYFSFGLEHGYGYTQKVLALTELDSTNRVVMKINGMPPLSEYCRQMGLDPQEVRKNFIACGIKNPLGIIDADGSAYIKSVILNSDGETFCSTSRMVQNSNAQILSYDEPKIISALSDALTQARTGNEDKKIAVALAFSCSSRRYALGDKAVMELEVAKKTQGEIPIFGFYSFGEIGARRNKTSRYNNQTITSLIIYDSLLAQ